MSERDPFARYLERMAAIGFRPSSVLGQNFLLDPSLHRWIAERAAPNRGDLVIEIGVGLGFLTRELAALADRVLAVEIDGRLLQLAREELADRPQVTFVHGDALGGPQRQLHPEITAAAAAAAAVRQRLLVVANLPYAVSGPLLAELLQLPVLPDRAVLLVQKEMAQRVAAPVGSGDYGSLSALVQAGFVATLCRDVSPQVFRPRPKVMSAILQLERRASGGMLDADAPARRQFATFVRQLFQQRRKVLRTTLPKAAAAVGLQPAAGAALGQRAEDLAPDELVALWRECVAMGPLPR